MNGELPYGHPWPFDPQKGKSGLDGDGGSVSTSRSEKWKKTLTERSIWIKRSIDHHVKIESLILTVE